MTSTDRDANSHSEADDSAGHSRWNPATSGVLLALALALFAVVVVAMRHIPFQDVPLHYHALGMARTLARGGTHPYLELPSQLTIGYSLYAVLSRVTAGILSTYGLIRLLVIAIGIMIPITIGRLGGAAGVSVRTVAILALPLTLCWPMRIGLLPYCLALPWSFLALHQAWKTARTGEFRSALWLSALLLLCYTSHAVTFGATAILVLLLLAVCSPTARGLLSVGAAMLPAMIALVRDRMDHGFAMIEGAENATLSMPLVWRTPLVALAHLATRSWGLRDARELAWYLPFLVVIGVCAPIGAVRLWRKRERTIPLLTVFAAVAPLVLPDSSEHVFLLGSRLSVFFAVFATICAAVALQNGRSWVRGVAWCAAIFVFIHSLDRMQTAARDVADVVETPGRGALTGRYLVVQVADCQTPSTEMWGGFDPQRHLWIYALAERGTTPYFFAVSRYLPIWYRPEAFLSHELRAPYEHLMLENERRLSDAACQELAVGRLASAMAWPGYDGTIVVGSSRRVHSAVESLSGAPVPLAQIAPGIFLARQRKTLHEPVHIDLGSPYAFAYLRSGFGDPETSDGRTVQWSTAKTSVLRVPLYVSDGPHRISWRARSFEKQEVIVAFDGQPVAAVQMRPAWTEYEVTVWTSQSHEHELSFTHEKTFVPTLSDRRELSVLYDEVTVAPVLAHVDLDVGTEEARPCLLDGFGPNEAVEGRDYAWTLGPRAHVALALDRRPVPYRLTVVGRAIVAQGIGASIDGIPLGTAQVGTDASELVWDVPARPSFGLRALVEFEIEKPVQPHSLDRSSHDYRWLGLMIDRIRLVSGSSETLDVGATEERGHLLAGFSSQEKTGDRTASWIEGTRASVRLASAPPSDAVIRVTARTLQELAPLSVELRSGGRTMGNLAFGESWSTELLLTRDSQWESRELEIVSTRATRPTDGGDTRVLSLFVDRIDVVSAASSDYIDLGVHAAPYPVALSGGWSSIQEREGRAGRFVFGVGRVKLATLGGPSCLMAITTLGRQPREGVDPASLQVALDGTVLGTITATSVRRTSVFRLDNPLEAGVHELTLEGSRESDAILVEEIHLGPA